MAHGSKGTVAGQVQSAVVEQEEAAGLPFKNLLSAEKIAAALERAGVKFRDRIYTPMVTIWAFLSQVTAEKDASAEKAVARVLAERALNGQMGASPDTSSYCAARIRLPEEVIPDLARTEGQELHGQAESEWLWKGRPVVIVDGSTCTMADTPENQKEYPQSKNQKPGLGFPILRFVTLLSLSVATVLDTAIGSCRGKKTGEQSLFREIQKTLKSGDILLGDRLYDCYRDIAMLKKRGIDSVFGKKQSRRVDFRKGRRLGPKDHTIMWKRPDYDATRYGSREEWEALPKEMEMREVQTIVRRKGYRSRTIIIVTTLLDADQYSSKDLTNLFAMRWHCELDLRSIKQSLGMHHLRCKTPAMVRKELWAYMLAYNLIRGKMARAARVHDQMPRTLSFTSAKTHINSFALPLRIAKGAAVASIEKELLRIIARCKIKNRPGRKEPRAVKRRTQKYSYLTKPRAEARKGLMA